MTNYLLKVGMKIAAKLIDANHLFARKIPFIHVLGYSSRCHEINVDLMKFNQSKFHEGLLHWLLLMS